MNESQGVALKSHIDKFCGEKPDAIFHEELTGITVARFNNIPDDGLTTYISIGLSGHILSQQSGQKIRQELLVTVDNEFSELPIEDVIFVVAKSTIEKHFALMRGEVIDSGGLLFPEISGVRLTSILCSYPAFFSDDFSFFENEETTVFVELIPITTDEAEFVHKEGWSKLFDNIDEGVIDILNLRR